MAWNKIIAATLSALVVLLVVTACSIKYKFTSTSTINYDKVKSISILDFPLKSAYVYTPLATKFNDDLKDIFTRQTHLNMVKNGGDLHIEGEIVGYNQYNESVQSDGYSSKTKLTITVNVRYVNNTDHKEDFERQFTAFRTYDSTQLLTSVQDELIAQMTKEITEQIFNATVANW